jgi:hypothetical protein
MIRPSLLICALSVIFGSACELVVTDGQTATLGAADAVFAVLTPNAVRVQPGGTLVVEGADVVGRGVRVEALDAVPPDVLGPAVVSEGGFVRVRRGTLSGGNLLVVANDPATPPNPPQGSPIDLLLSPRPLPSALVATDSVVEIEGGTLVSGSQPGPTGAERFFTLPALSLTRGELAIRGGEFLRGEEALSFFLIPPRVVVSALQARVAISGGSFDGWVRLAGSQSRISGGQVGRLVLGPALPQPSGPGCTEIQGGGIATVLIISPDETLLILGTGFNQPLGLVPITAVSPPDFPEGNPDTPSARVSGVLADGRAFSLNVFTTTLDAKVVLAPPGAARCAP